MAACGGGGDAADPQVGSPEPPSSQKVGLQGRYVGTVTIDGTSYYGDALLTVDGAVRLYVGGPYDGDGAVQTHRPEASAQFAGTLDEQADPAQGSGRVIGLACSRSGHSTYCGAGATARISVATQGDDLDGEIRVTTDGTEVRWRLVMKSWSNYYDLPAKLGGPAGAYEEELAEFATGTDTTVTVDASGRLFFQSAQSGCTGNGTLSPHLGGEFNVYDVSITIEGCDAPHAGDNGDFAGFATTSPSSYWDYDSLLRIWLSGTGDRPTALMMSGSPL